MEFDDDFVLISPDLIFFTSKPPDFISRFYFFGKSSRLYSGDLGSVSFLQHTVLTRFIALTSSQVLKHSDLVI